MAGPHPAARLGLPDLGDGVGLREPHFTHLMRTAPADWGVDWFEIISENFLDHAGYAAHVLEVVCAHRPVVMHGVSLSIGGADPLDRAYLDKLAALAHVVDRIKAVQDRLGRPLILENPSSYLEFRSSQMPEWEFLGRMAEAADCGLLLDVNNVHVSGFNQGFDPVAYIDVLPAERVVQVHLAGPSDIGGFLMDTHDAPVPDAVWPLYVQVQARTGGVSTLLEWDANIPAWPDLLAELAKAKAARAGWLPAATIPVESRRVQA